MTSQGMEQGRVIPLRAGREPLWRDVVGDVLRRERLAQGRTLKDVADTAMISLPYLSELERGRKEASSEVLAAAARSLGLGLAQLLALAQEELARIALVRVRSDITNGGHGGVRQQVSSSGVRATTGSSRRTELCLAA